MKKCAIYTRVSTSMQAELEYSSCDAQKDRTLSFIKSQEGHEFFKEYSDPGFSGGSLDRPALQELLRDIKEKKIDEVLTYKIDRLTRSSKDFYALIEYFEKYEVAYVSVTERFDTSSPSGRLLRNIMLTFAQFEREMASERVKDKLEQQVKKGIWCGGLPPIGYKKVNKRIVVDNKKAAQVKALFERFVETGRFTDVMRLVTQNDIRNPKHNNLLTAHCLYYLLRNPIYIGQIRWKDKFYEGIHEPIISKELFLEAQGLTKEKIVKKRLYKEFLLTSLVKCSDCKSGMTNVFTNKKKRRYYYYKCHKVIRQGKSACSIKEVNAEKLEAFIAENLERISKDKNYVESLVFKMLRNLPPSSGLELSTESEKMYSEKILHVLQRYVSDYKNATQVEKVLVTKKTVERIIFKRDSLELSIIIEDRTKIRLEKELSNRLGGAARGAREGAVNPDAPACSTGSNVKLVTLTCPVQTRTDFSPTFNVILPHNLLDRSRMF